MKEQNGIARIAAACTIVGVVAGVGGSSLTRAWAAGSAVGAAEARLEAVESAVRSARADHDDIVAIKARVEAMDRKLDAALSRR